ncbi:MAG: hypothetical protein WC023_08105 [Rhodocyclaceae bacterium]
MANTDLTTVDYSEWVEAIHAQQSRKCTQLALRRATFWSSKTDDQLIEDALDVARENSLLQVLAFRLQAALDKLDARTN